MVNNSVQHAPSGIAVLVAHFLQRRRNLGRALRLLTEKVEVSSTETRGEP